MIKKSKIKKGSSLLITVAMFAILSILIMSVLAMTTTGYNLRIKNNRRIENFYGADSGLDIARSLVYKYLEDAISAADSAVDKTQNIKEQEKQFKESYINEIRKSTIAAIGDLKLEAEINDLTNYSDINRKSDIRIKSRLFLVTKDRKIKPADGKGNADLTVADDLRANLVKSETYENIKSFELHVQSKFIKDNKEREVEVTFEIGIPEYGKQLVVGKVADSPSILDYIIGVDGNYTLENIGSTEVLGDLWVKGKSEDYSKDIALAKKNKYKNGLTLKSSQEKGNIEIKGKIATFSNLIIDNVLLSFEENKTTKENREVFAKNVVINNIDKQIKNQLGSNVDMYVYNDLVMNGKNSNVEVNNFYGLNDINTYEETENIFLSDLERSSSIIINNDDYGKGSSLNVNNDAYILGTPYIDLGDANAYQTGHAISTNKITRPYSYRNYNDGNEYVYDYKGNLQLIDSIGENKLTLEQKKEIFKKYYKATGSSELALEDKILANGTQINGNIYSVGAILNKGQLVTDNKHINQEKVKELQNIYVKEVFNMGEDGDYTEKDFWEKKLNLTVEDSFNWEGMSKEINKNYTGHDDLIKVKGNSEFIHLRTTKDLGEIVDKAKGEKGQKHPVTAYTPISGSETYNLNLILNSSDTPIEIRSSATSENKIIKDEDENKIIYEVNLQKKYDKLPNRSTLTAAPLLVISKGDVVIEDTTGFNFSMIISAGDAEIKLKKAGSYIGNYVTPSDNKGEIEYENGQYKFVNELFKYALGSMDIMGEIGNGIFNGAEEIISTNAIEVSYLINKKNWKLNK